MSYGASTQSNWVDTLSAASSGDGPAGEPAAPQVHHAGWARRRRAGLPGRRPGSGRHRDSETRRSRAVVILVFSPHSCTKPLASDWSKVSCAS